MQLTSCVVVLALLVAQSGTLRPRIGSRVPSDGPPPPAAPTILIHTPDTAPTASVSTAALTVAGIAADDTLVTAVTWTCPQCSVTSGTATGTTSWTFNVTLACSAGAGTSNTITVTASDGTLTTPDIITVTCIIPDAGGPTVIIDIPTTNTTDSVTSASYTLGGSCGDDVGCATVTVACATCADTSVEATLSGNGDRWTADMVLASGANAMTVTGRDAALQEGTDSITVTYTPDLVWSTGAALGTFRTTDNTTRTLTATGGTGTITYAEVVDGGDVLGAADCADITLASTGVLTISTPPAQPVTCSFTVRATDSAGSPDTADREFTLIVSDSAEGSNDYFDAMVALDAAAGANSIVKNWSLRTGQAAINAQDSGSIANPVWHYEFGGSDCYGGTCDDASFDGAKFEPPPEDPSNSGHVLRFSAGSSVDLSVAGTRVLATWDFMYGTTFKTLADASVASGAGGFHRKQYGLGTMSSPTGTAGLATSILEMHESNSDVATGNGAGANSIGAVEYHAGGVVIAAPGTDGWDPFFATGEGGLSPGDTTPLLANIHVHHNVITRFWSMYTARQRLSSSVFDEFRTMRSLGTGKFEIESCVVSSGRARCRSAATWVGNKLGANAGPFAREGHDVILHIEGSEASGLNGEWTATFGDDDEMTWVAADLPAAPTVANTGAGSYAATIRYYKVAYRIKSGATITGQSELSSATSFTPSGSGTHARVTKPATISAGETHWVVYGSADNTTFYELAETVVGTTTYDDNEAPADYDTHTEAVETHRMFVITGTGVADGTYTAGTFDPEFTAVHVWIADENREATRWAWGIPIRHNPDNKYVQLTWNFDTSFNGTRSINPVGWGRNVVILKNPTLDLSGTCLNDDPTVPIASNERGNCTVDATNNPTILKKPVR